MKFARVFLNPNGDQWVDFPIPETAALPQIWGQVMMEGAFYSVGAVVPRAAVHHIMQIEMVENNVVNFTTVPGGKPN